MTRKQFLSMMKCEQCFLGVKEEFLDSNPDKANLFDDIKKIYGDELHEMIAFASYVLQVSEHPLIVYPGEFDQDETFMRVIGFRGVYMAYNDNDERIFFDTLKSATKYVDDRFEYFQKNVWNAGYI